jgi:hypothetical protein
LPARFAAMSAKTESSVSTCFARRSRPKAWRFNLVELMNVAKVLRSQRFFLSLLRPSWER